jgi:serine/threonine-protein kinase RsbW
VWLRVPARPECVGVARQVLAGLCEAVRLDPRLTADVRLAVTEACTNVVVHAYAEAAAPGVIEVEAEPQGAGLRVIVRDDGRGFAPRVDSQGLGLGLPLIKALTTDMAIRGRSNGGGTEVEMAFVAAEPDPPS